MLDEDVFSFAIVAIGFVNRTPERGGVILRSAQQPPLPRKLYTVRTVLNVITPSQHISSTQEAHTHVPWSIGDVYLYGVWISIYMDTRILTFNYGVRVQ